MYVLAPWPIKIACRECCSSFGLEVANWLQPRILGRGFGQSYCLPPQARARPPSVLCQYGRHIQKKPTIHLRGDCGEPLTHPNAFLM